MILVYSVNLTDPDPDPKAWRERKKNNDNDGSKLTYVFLRPPTSTENNAFDAQISWHRIMGIQSGR